jgi:predicted RNase H-like nuclease (RuvC/YqgF family)
MKIVEKLEELLQLRRINARLEHENKLLKKEVRGYEDQVKLLKLKLRLASQDQSDSVRKSEVPPRSYKSTDKQGT